ncbi:MAG: transcriptional repressor [Desulfomonilaceae bacterium]|nr:transcriptional repressor [Desulfomonilaceae bacterium]
MIRRSARRMTRQRKIVLEELRKVTSHPTADQLHQMVRRRLPGINIATVYRNLEILTDEGEVMKLDVAGTQRRFDGNALNHYHIRCSRCGRVDDVHMDVVDSLEEAAAKACAYTVLSHTVEFVGICPGCRDGN